MLPGLEVRRVLFRSKALGELHAREGSREAPSNQEQEPVGKALDVAQLVRTKEESASLPAASLDEAIKGTEPLRVERRGRLVQKHDRSVRQRRDREAQPLNHSSGVRRDRAGGGAVQRRQAQDLAAA